MATGISQYVFPLDTHGLLVLQNILMNSLSRHSFMALLRLQRRLVAVFTLLVIMTLCVSVECHAVGPKDSGLHATTGVVLPATEHTDSPCCPIDDHGHTDADHCTSCLHCACNAPLAALETILSYAPSLSLLNPFDRFNLLPEVYLPIFIPPQNLS